MCRFLDSFLSLLSFWRSNVISLSWTPASKVRLSSCFRARDPKWLSKLWSWGLDCKRISGYVCGRGFRYVERLSPLASEYDSLSSRYQDAESQWLISASENTICILQAFKSFLPKSAVLERIREISSLSRRTSSGTDADPRSTSNKRPTYFWHAPRKEALLAFELEAQWSSV